MHPLILRFAAPKTLLVTGAAATLAIASASTAYAADLDTSATVSTSLSAPSIVSVGDNSFTISITATGNLPSARSGTATVTTKYFMAADGTITASTNTADLQTLHFSPGTNYSSDCTQPSPALGCSTNPFVVTADLVVAAGTPGGSTGTLTVAGTGSQGLTADTSPAVGYVKVADSNHAPTAPGAPILDASSTTPNNTGAFTIAWAAATDPDVGDVVTYALQKRDADDTNWTDVATGLTANSYSFTGEAEGSWRYQVQATDNHGATSAFAIDGTPVVVVDETAPNSPTASTDSAPAYTDGTGNNWYKDSVTVLFAAAGDANLTDGSAGSGVASVTPSESFSSTGVFHAQGHATDHAGNSSAEASLVGYVDATAPTVEANCPTNVVLNDSTATASWTASDVGSGLATASSGSVPLDTSTVGDHTVAVPAGTAADNVGHLSGAAQCSYHVGYAFGGFLQPINDTAHFVGQTTSVFKAGSTIPVKFQLFDANGTPVQAAVAPSWLTPAKGSALASTVTVDESTYLATASSGSVFKWDATSQQYIYNYKTDKSQSGNYWRSGVALDDGSTIFVSVALK